jgi:hypothetical protein
MPAFTHQVPRTSNKARVDASESPSVVLDAVRLDQSIADTFAMIMRNQTVGEPSGQESTPKKYKLKVGRDLRKATPALMTKLNELDEDKAEME